MLRYEQLFVTIILKEALHLYYCLNIAAKNNDYFENTDMQNTGNATKCAHILESLCPCIHWRMLPTHCVVASALVDGFSILAGNV